MSEKLDFDTDFLDSAAPSKKKGKHPALPKKSAEDSWKTGAGILGALLVAGLIVYAAASGGGASAVDTASTGQAPIVANTDAVNTTPPAGSPTTGTALQGFIVNGSDTTAPKTKTPSQICKTNYGSQSYATGDKNDDGTPVCDCNDGYQWNDAKTACVAVPAVQTPLQICQSRNGYNATYDSASNSCGCPSGYSVSATTNQCVDALTARDDSCAAKFPGTSYLKADPTDGHPICDCVAGSYFNDARTACYTLSAFNQSCVNTFGTGSISTTENNKRVCDCGYGYAFNPQRDACVTTASINAICERDVGRNSVYSGSSSNGKYNCTAAY